MPSARQEMPKTEFAGCMIVEEERIYPATGKVEMGHTKMGVPEPGVPSRWW